MSATDELRRLLDERGVEWESKDVEGIPGFHDTRWNAYDVRWCYVEFVGNNYTKLVPSSEFHCTPEQAIAATLGSGALTAEQVQETVEKHWHDLSDEYDMPEATALPEYSYDWQTITDELNSRAERTCKLVETDRYTNSRETIHVLECSECGETCEHVNGIYPRCPHCGAKAVGD